MFVGNGGPNLVSSFHVIGEIFDKVYTEGGRGQPARRADHAGPRGRLGDGRHEARRARNLHLVDHSIFRAFNKGALGMLKVEGGENKTIYSGKQNDLVYLPEGGAVQAVPNEASAAPERELPRNELLARGQQVFAANCAACHQLGGEGVAGAFPPLAKSDFLMADKDRAIGVVMRGLSGGNLRERSEVQRRDAESRLQHRHRGGSRTCGPTSATGDGPRVVARCPACARRASEALTGAQRAVGVVTCTACLLDHARAVRRRLARRRAVARRSPLPHGDGGSRAPVLPRGGRGHGAGGGGVPARRTRREQRRLSPVCHRQAGVAANACRAHRSRSCLSAALDGRYRAGTQTWRHRRRWSTCRGSRRTRTPSGAARASRPRRSGSWRPVVSGVPSAVRPTVCRCSCSRPTVRKCRVRRRAPPSA
jgi:mono/diheme cytochrome c family protein